MIIVNLSGTLHLPLDANTSATSAPDSYRWTMLLDSEDEVYGGRGALALTKLDHTLSLEGPRAMVLKAEKQ